MSKNVIVNGTNYTGVSLVELALTGGGTALFKDMDEIASMDNIVAIASGRFTPDQANTGVINSNYQYVFEHGMGTTPDLWVVMPKQFYCTQNNDLIIASYNARSKFHMAIGVRNYETNQIQNSNTKDVVYATETTVRIMGFAFGNFLPTYIDDEGNTGTQEYLWVAVKFAE